MKFRELVLISTALFSFSVFAAEEVTVQFSYAGDHGVDFSEMASTFRVAEFTDERGLEDPRLITDSDLGSAGGYQANVPLTEIIQDAFKQGFASGDAVLVDADEDMGISGKLLSSEAEIIERGGVEMIQLTLRVDLQLQKGGRDIWQTILFGRGRTPASEGMAATVQASLERLIRELIRDDYFLQEIL
jgi:hypothetical protein